VTGAALGRGRRWGAILLLRLAGVILRGATALYQRRAISGAELRAVLSAARFFERAGAVVALGTRSKPEPGRVKKDEDGADID
jgi:hypothetical protein